jgi:diguanylate cyclase (GGDEF)-like protein
VVPNPAILRGGWSAAKPDTAWRWNGAKADGRPSRGGHPMSGPSPSGQYLPVYVIKRTPGSNLGRTPRCANPRLCIRLFGERAVEWWPSPPVEQSATNRGLPRQALSSGSAKRQINDVRDTAPAETAVYRAKTLTSLVTGATAAIIALTACALYLVGHGSWSLGDRFWLMILASSSATLLVMSLLHSDLQRLYELLAQREEEAQQEARTDLLTGLPNRKHLGEVVEAKRSSCGQQSAILCLLDLNHFKRVNDTRGHEGGDELLVLTAKRLGEALPAAFIARLGGDEFAVLAEADCVEAAERLCRTITEVFEEPFALTNGGCFTRGSVGAAFLEPDLTTSELLRRADAAMYKAKSGTPAYRVFDEEMIEDVTRRARLAVDLRNAAPDFRDCSAAYQPILKRDGALAGFEALLRWNHPVLCQVPPGETVSVAEEVQLINELGLLIVEDACRAARAFPHATIAFNVSVVQLLDGRFDEALCNLVSRQRMPFDRFQLEIREGDFAARGQDMSGALRRLATAGFIIAVDDYGSSTTSLVQLQRYGASVLKLDPRVLRNAREVDSIAIMKAKVELAKALGMFVTCEGVSVEADRTAAIQAGCDMLQGYLLGKPEALDVLLKSAWMRKAA